VTALDPAHLVGLGGAVGAVLRFGVGRLLAGRALPLSTLAVNAVGTAVLGLVTFGGAAEPVVLAVGTGACGAFTTFSSFSFETVRLWETGERRLAALNASGNLVAAAVGLALAWVVVG
jgi:CrcB protein